LEVTVLDTNSSVADQLIHWNIGGGTERPGQEGTITFSNSWGEAKIYGFELPVVNFPFLRYAQVNP
jgi:hypothetical protein